MGCGVRVQVWVGLRCKGRVRGAGHHRVRHERAALLRVRVRVRVSVGVRVRARTLT